MFAMRLIVLLLLTTCLMPSQAKKRDRQPRKQKQKHRQWLKHPLYLPPGEHYIDESIQPGKQKSESEKMDHKTAKGPYSFYQYKSGQTGLTIPFYDPRNGKVGFARIPGYRIKTGKTGFETGQAGPKTGKAGFLPIAMYRTKTGKSGYKTVPMYYGKGSKTGQAGFVPIQIYRYRTSSKTGFKIPMYNAKTGRAGFMPFSMQSAYTKKGKTRFKNFPMVYDTRTGQAGFVPIPMHGIKFGKKSGALYDQTDLSQLAMMYQMIPGQPVQVPALPAIVPFDPSGMVPMLDPATQPMYVNLPAPSVQGMDASLPANQMSMMYPTSLTGETGLTGFENGVVNQELSQVVLPALPLVSPAVAAGDVLAQPVLGQANAQAKSIISGPKKHEASFTVSVDGVVRSFAKQGGSAVKLDAGGASISLSKKNKVLHNHFRKTMKNVLKNTKKKPQ